MSAWGLVIVQHQRMERSLQLNSNMDLVKALLSRLGLVSSRFPPGLTEGHQDGWSDILQIGIV